MKKNALKAVGDKILTQCVEDGMNAEDIRALSYLVRAGGTVMSVAGRKAAATRKAASKRQKNSARANRAWVTIRRRKAAGCYN